VAVEQGHVCGGKLDAAGGQKHGKRACLTPLLRRGQPPTTDKVRGSRHIVVAQSSWLTI